MWEVFFVVPPANRTRGLWERFPDLHLCYSPSCGLVLSLSRTLAASLGSPAPVQVSSQLASVCLSSLIIRSPLYPLGCYLDWLSLYFYISLGWGKARISAQFLAVSRLVLFLQRWDTFQNKPCTSCLYTLFSCCFLYACSSSWMEHCLTTSSE